MKQIWVTDKTKKIIDKEHEKQRRQAKKSGGAMPVKMNIIEMLVIEGALK